MDSQLERPVLVLNRLWQPVHTCSARRALKLLFLGHAQVVQTDGEAVYQTHDVASWLAHSSDRSRAGDLVRSISTVVRIPKIIVLSLYDRLPRRDVKFTRANIFLRDKHTCQYCAKVFSEKELNLDHVIPRDKGGPMSWENIVTSCIKCNTRKANKLAHQVGMKLLRPPSIPRWRPNYNLRNQSQEECWRVFIDLDPKEVQMKN